MFAAFSSYVWQPEPENTNPCPSNVTLDDSRVTEDGWVYVEEIVAGASQESSPRVPEHDVTEKTAPQIIYVEAEADIAEREQGSAESSKTSSSEDTSGNVSEKTSLQILFDEMDSSDQDHSDCNMKTAEGSPEVSMQTSLQFPFEFVNNEMENRPSTSQESTTVTADGGFEVIFPTPLTSTTTTASTFATPQPRIPSTQVNPPISMCITRSQKRLRVAMALGAHASEKKPRMPLTRSQSAASSLRMQRYTRHVNSTRPQVHSHGKRKKRLNQTADKHSGRGGRRGC